MDDPVDREIGRQMLRALRLVSRSEFERGVQDEIEKILSSVGKENVALIPLTGPAPQVCGEEKERSTPASGADGVRQMVENLRRVYGSRVLADPTIDSMRAERVRNIVIVEDYVGMGKRLSDFWAEQIDASIKSWISYGWVQLWLVTYAADAEGLRRVREKLPKLSPARVRPVLPTSSIGIRPTIPMAALTMKYAHRVSRSDIPLGSRSRGSLIVFEHACPNDAPVMLWASGKKWQPIFPDRGIPEDIRCYFDDPDLEREAEPLWDPEQHALASGFLNHVRLHKADSIEWRLLLALGHSSHSTWDDTRLSAGLRISGREVSELREDAYRLGVLSTQDCRLTVFGQELLSFVERGALSQSRHSRSAPSLRRLTDLYYPDSCGGIAKHQSNVAI